LTRIFLGFYGAERHPESVTLYFKDVNSMADYLSQISNGITGRHTSTKSHLGSNQQTPPWCKLEAQTCVSSSLLALLTSSIPINPSGFTKNQVVCSTLKIWYQFRRHFKFNSASTLAPLLRNHLFQPAISDSTFSIWHNKGLTMFKDLYKDGTFCSFAELSNKFQLPPLHFFRYLQIRHCVRPAFPSLPPMQLWDEFLNLNPLQKPFISKVYDKLLSYDSSPATKVKVNWERELGLNLEDNWWDVALNKIYTSSTCARLTLIQFKVLFRIHFSKAQLSQIYPTVTDSCDRCHASSCNLTHMFYSCPLLLNFWQNYFNTMSKIPPSYFFLSYLSIFYILFYLFSYFLFLSFSFDALFPKKILKKCGNKVIKHVLFPFGLLY